MDVVLIDIKAMLGAALVAALVVGVIANAIAHEMGEEPRARIQITILIAAMALIGGVVGVTGGMSRVGAVGDIGAAALGLLGSVAVVLFGTDRSRGTIASFSASAFVLSLGFGYSAGAANRQDADRYLTSLEFCSGLLSDPEILSSDEAYCRAFSSFGLSCAYIMASDLSWSQPTVSEGLSISREVSLQQQNEQLKRVMALELSSRSCRGAEAILGPLETP